jgi:hypothetical protein
MKNIMNHDRSRREFLYLTGAGAGAAGANSDAARRLSAKVQNAHSQITASN